MTGKLQTVQELHRDILRLRDVERLECHTIAAMYGKGARYIENVVSRMRRQAGKPKRQDQNEQFSEKCKDILRLRDRGYSCTAIGIMYGSTTHCIEVLISRARKKFAQQELEIAISKGKICKYCHKPAGNPRDFYQSLSAHVDCIP